MTITANSKKLESIKALTMMSAVIVIASVVMITVWQIPQAIAASLEQLRVSHKISAPVDQVWKIVSDVTMIQNIGLLLKTSKISTRQIT
jgi:hypothetical protein